MERNNKHDHCHCCVLMDKIQSNNWWKHIIFFIDPCKRKHDNSCRMSSTKSSKNPQQKHHSSYLSISLWFCGSTRKLPIRIGKYREIMKYPPWNQHSPWKWMVGILVSFWDGLFSGAMFVSRRVIVILIHGCFTQEDGGNSLTKFSVGDFPFLSYIFRLKNSCDAEK